ncbi:MAG: hypothetical protein NVSMB46_00220 [Candidatus Saccharimonadales bacterium]
MLSNITVGIIMGIGTGGWVYSKMMRRTGNNTKSALLIAAVAGGLALLVIVTALQLVHFSSN